MMTEAELVPTMSQSPCAIGPFQISKSGDRGQ
uniref:Uncharacterized protein n=1 Tax=Anguilla anguilla TaxID=7936 RepID=A0A0E9TRV1_ANGAN